MFIESGSDHENFRKNVRTYNNNFAFTSLGVKYDKELTKNKDGIYAFRVVGQMYHYLSSVGVEEGAKSGIEFYFFDTDTEISRRVDSFPKLFCESVVRKLRSILDDNPYVKFFKVVRSIEVLEDFNILLTCSPVLDQRRYNMPNVPDVAAILSECDGPDFNRSAHIQVYLHSEVPCRIKHFFGIYDPLQYPILFPYGQTGWHNKIQKVKCRKIDRVDDGLCGDDGVCVDSISDPMELLNSEEQGFISSSLSSLILILT